jgi:cobalt/nickel transport system permease protein
MHHHEIDRLAYQDSPIHRLDPRAKTIAVVAYSVALISLPRYTLPSPWYCVFPAVLLLWGGIPLRFVLKHALLVSLFILFAALLAPVFDATPVRFGHRVVRGGWVTALSLMLRFLLGMGSLIALAGTTRFAELLKGLEQMRAPRVFINQLRFLYRYLFLLIDQVMQMRQARAARDAGRGPFLSKWKASGGQVGVLFLRTLEGAERMHLAMIARGYHGHVHLLRPLQWRLRDRLVLLLRGVYVLFGRWVDQGAIVA